MRLSLKNKLVYTIMGASTTVLMLTIIMYVVFDVARLKKNKVKDILDEAEKYSQNNDISDQAKYLVDQKIEVLKSLTLN